MPRPSSPPRAATAPARCATRPRRSDGCRSTASDFDAVDLPRLQVALRAARRRRSSRCRRGLRARRCRRSSPGWYAGRRSRGRPATGTRSSSPSDARGSTSRPPGRRSSAPSRRSSCSPRSTPRSCTTTRRASRRAFRERIGLAEPERASAIVTWADPDGTRPRAAHRRRASSASGRAGRARVAFHVFNDERRRRPRAGGARPLKRSADRAGCRVAASTARPLRLGERASGVSATATITATPTTRASPP